MVREVLAQQAEALDLSPRVGWSGVGVVRPSFMSYFFTRSNPEVKYHNL